MAVFAEGVSSTEDAVGTEGPLERRTFVVVTGGSEPPAHVFVTDEDVCGERCDL